MNVVQSLGQVDWDDFESIEEVITWMITVIVFDQFVEPAVSSGEVLSGVTFIVSVFSANRVAR